MDASFVPKRPFDPSTLDRPEPHTPTASASSTKRRHQPPPSTSSASPFKTPPPPLKLAAGETLFRILCPAIRTGGVIGKGGAIIRHVREETGARIRIDDSVPGCEERVILIVAESVRKDRNSTIDGKQNTDIVDVNGEESANSSSIPNGEEDGSPAQQALVRVFERMLKVDDERSGASADNERGEEKKEEGGNVGGGGAALQGQVTCRLLAPSNQVGCVLGRGGKIVERIRHDSGAQIRVLPKDQIPACASPGDELIQVLLQNLVDMFPEIQIVCNTPPSFVGLEIADKIIGNYLAVKKALLSVSGCLQDKPRADAVNSAASKSSGIALHGTGTENIGANHRMVLEEDVVFKLLCQIDKVGSLIGKGGSVIRALQSETGASIKIVDAAPDSDERVVVISARENSEQRHSPAQDAVIRVHCRIAEIGFEPGAAVVARLLVHSQQIGCLLGKGGIVIAELRRVTGASIRIFPKEQILKCGSQNDEVVQVIGSLQSVQDALYQITSRLRETIFPMKPHHSSVSGSPYMSPYLEMPPPLFRPRHDPASPGHYPSPIGPPHGVDRVAMPAQPFDSHPAFSHGMDRLGPTYLDRVPYPYGSERPGHGPSFDRQSSPRRWTSQAVSSGNPSRVADAGGGLASNNGPIGSGSQAPIVASTTVEVVIPMTLLSHVYGENNGNLGQIRQISGAKVIVHDPRPGATEGVVIVSGAPDQIRAAQSLIQAFILSEQTS